MQILVQTENLQVGKLTKWRMSLNICWKTKPREPAVSLLFMEESTHWIEYHFTLHPPFLITNLVFQGEHGSTKHACFYQRRNDINVEFFKSFVAVWFASFFACIYCGGSEEIHMKIVVQPDKNRNIWDVRENTVHNVNEEWRISYMDYMYMRKKMIADFEWIWNSAKSV